MRNPTQDKLWCQFLGLQHDCKTPDLLLKVGAKTGNELMPVATSQTGSVINVCVSLQSM